MSKPRSAKQRASAVERALGVSRGTRNALCVPGSVQTSLPKLGKQRACYAAPDWLRSAALNSPALLCTAATA